MIASSGRGQAKWEEISHGGLLVVNRVGQNEKIEKL